VGEAAGEQPSISHTKPDIGHVQARGKGGAAMGLVRTSSLAATVDAIGEAVFFGKLPAKAERREAARWIASRQGLRGSYGGMFAPTEKDFAEGVRMFTGERIATGAGVGHILGEEACRALLVLDAGDATAADALKRATDGMLALLERHYAEGRGSGTFCCGKCSVSLWRHLAAGGLNQRRRRLADGMARLNEHRDGKGRWRVFPFHYTVLALTEIGPAARAELRYAAAMCERLAGRKGGGDKYACRRRSVAERALALC
jgi:hypothetical protein